MSDPQDLEEAIIDELVRRGLVSHRTPEDLNQTLASSFLMRNLICYLDVIGEICYCRLRRSYSFDLRDPNFMEKLATLIQGSIVDERFYGSDTLRISAEPWF